MVALLVLNTFISLYTFVTRSFKPVYCAYIHMFTFQPHTNVNISIRLVYPRFQNTQSMQSTFQKKYEPYIQRSFLFYVHLLEQYLKID